MPKTRIQTVLSLLIAASVTLLSLNACKADTPGAQSSNSSGSESADGAPEAKAASSSTKPFKHTEPDVAIEYPGNWTIVEVKAPFLFKMRDPSGRANINGSFEPVPADMTHVAFAKAVEDLYGTRPEMHYKKISEEEITVSGIKAIKRLHTLGEEDKPAKQMSVYFTRDSVGYSVNCTTLPAWYTQFEPIFNKVIESVKL